VLDIKNPCVTFLSIIVICISVVIYLLDFDYKKLKSFIQDMPQACAKFLCHTHFHGCYFFFVYCISVFRYFLYIGKSIEIQVFE